MIIESLGRCLTLRKSDNFQELTEKYKSFFEVDQWQEQPEFADTDVGRLVLEPVLQNGAILYGIESDGSLTWLGEIIDSSD